MSTKDSRGSKREKNNIVTWVKRIAEGSIYLYHLEMLQDRSKCCCLCTPKTVPYPKFALMIKRVSCKRKQAEPPEEVLSKDDINELTDYLRVGIVL